MWRRQPRQKLERNWSDSYSGKGTKEKSVYSTYWINQIILTILYVYFRNKFGINQKKSSTFRTRAFEAQWRIEARVLQAISFQIISSSTITPWFKISILPRDSITKISRLKINHKLHLSSKLTLTCL